MGMFEMSPEQVVEWRQNYRDLVATHVNREEVVAAAAFRRGGAAASMAASKARLGAVAYAGIKLFNKKKAGGLPERVMLAVTPEKVYAFTLGSPAEGEKATLVGIGVRDDPISKELMAVLEGAEHAHAAG